MDTLQQLQRRPKGRTAAGCFGRLDDKEQLVGPVIIALCPITGGVTDYGGKQEPVMDGSAAMRVDPSLKRNPDEGCWVAFRPFPIPRDSNVQIDERLRQDHSQAVISNQPMD